METFLHEKPWERLGMSTKVIESCYPKHGKNHWYHNRVLLELSMILKNIKEHAKAPSQLNTIENYSSVCCILAKSRKDIELCEHCFVATKFPDKYDMVREAKCGRHNIVSKDNKKGGTDWKLVDGILFWGN